MFKILICSNKISFNNPTFQAYLYQQHDATKPGKQMLVLQQNFFVIAQASHNTAGFLSGYDAFVCSIIWAN